MAEEKNSVQSVERIFTIIEILARHHKGCSLQQVAAECNLAKSTAHRLLASLIGLGYVTQDTVTAQYKLTLKMFEISSGIVNDIDVMSTAKPHLDRLAQRTAEAVHLVIRDGEDIVYLYKAESGPMGMRSRMGMRIPMYCTGVGKAILATLPAPEVERIWRNSQPRKMTGKTIVDWDTFQEQLKQVRLKGYAVDDEENEQGIRCVGVAIPGPGGRADSAFSISGLVPHMEGERLGRIAVMALETRQDIMHDLGVASRK